MKFSELEISTLVRYNPVKATKVFWKLQVENEVMKKKIEVLEEALNQAHKLLKSLEEATK